jgi:hypothetical protein
MAETESAPVQETLQQPQKPVAAPKALIGEFNSTFIKFFSENVLGFFDQKFSQKQWRKKREQRIQNAGVGSHFLFLIFYYNSSIKPFRIITDLLLMELFWFELR